MKNLYHLFSEYGTDVSTTDGARAYLSAVRGRSPLRLAPISSDREYSRIVRRLHSRRVVDHPLAGDGGYIDGRLLAAGWCLSTPTRWVSELEDWLTYYSQAVERPMVVGSDYHILGPAEIAIARRIGVPAWVLRPLQRRLPAALRVLRLDERRDATRTADVAVRRRATERVPRRVITRMRRIARAVGRTSAGFTVARRRSHRPTITRPICARAWAALGRVSPEVQRAMLEHLAHHPVVGDGPLRVRDLPWEVGARVARDCARAPIARAAWATGERHSRLVFALPVEDQHRLNHPLGALLARGMTPAIAVDRYARLLEHYDADAPRLSAREASRYCEWALGSDSMYQSHCPAQWLVNTALASTTPRLPSLSVPAGDVGVARWLCAVLAHAPRRESLFRVRRVRHAGATHEIRFTSRLDEIRWRDIAMSGGIAAGVDAVFETAARRLAVAIESQWERDDRQMCAAPSWIAPVPGVTVLTTPRLLVEEGRELGHCVGTYVPPVWRGDALIISVRTPDGLRSTAELTRAGAIRQHHGPANSDPPLHHRHMLAAAISSS